MQSNEQILEKIQQARDKNAPLYVSNIIKWASRVGIAVRRFRISYLYFYTTTKINTIIGNLALEISMFLKMSKWFEKGNMLFSKKSCIFKTYFFRWHQPMFITFLGKHAYCTDYQYKSKDALKKKFFFYSLIYFAK